MDQQRQTTKRRRLSASSQSSRVSGAAAGLPYLPVRCRDPSPPGPQNPGGLAPATPSPRHARNTEKQLLN